MLDVLLHYSLKQKVARNDQLIKLNKLFRSLSTDLKGNLSRKVRIYNLVLSINTQIQIVRTVSLNLDSWTHGESFIDTHCARQVCVCMCVCFVTRKHICY